MRKKEKNNYAYLPNFNFLACWSSSPALRFSAILKIKIKNQIS